MFELYPPKRGKKGGGDEESREDEYDAWDSEDCGVEHEDVAHLQPSDGEKATQEATASCCCLLLTTRAQPMTQQEAPRVLRRWACPTMSK